MKRDGFEKIFPFVKWDNSELVNKVQDLNGIGVIYQNLQTISISITHLKETTLAQLVQLSHRKYYSTYE